MRIGILGAGGMADALGTQWARAGHEVMVSGRDESSGATRAKTMIAALTATPGEVRPTSPGGPEEVQPGSSGGPEEVRTGSSGGPGEVRSGSFAEVAAFSEVVVVAVREAGLLDTLRATGTALRGKPLIDLVNTADIFAYDPTRPIARLIADVTGGHVVKAFNLCNVDVWRMTPPVFDGRPLAVPLCGDDQEALDAARTLVTALGCTPVDGGGLDRAMLLEATAAFVIGLWFGGADAQAILPPLVSSGEHRCS
ncbi:NAD(P)-binding domain-containing protein [Nonomuraea sp. NPDC049419]|uniref:NADPH-dependent F420 reductase n=1 Tax=Nonomuraea sp. NPDC049419 TaxID=3155772 RepID=UPI00341B0981